MNVKKKLVIVTLTLMSLSSTLSTFATDDISALLGTTASTGSTATDTSTGTTTGVSSGTTTGVSSGTTNTGGGDLGGLGNKISDSSTNDTAPVNIDVTNGKWNQTIRDSNIILYFKATKDIPVESLFSVSYKTDLQNDETIKGTDLKTYFDISTVRVDGSELTLASGELKTVKAGDELKVNLTANSSLLNKDISFTVPSEIIPEKYGILDTTGGDAKVKVLGIYNVIGKSLDSASIDTKGDMANSDSGSVATTDVAPKTKTGAEENILMLLLAILVLGGLFFSNQVKMIKQ